ncbi:dynein axonemal light chain 1-like [Babylonia areolata]|uniref:dynein axonemal light chain 1-like n=1 Tax=Babylonia areolata TaxID=304850 RepID=UPI003FD6B8A1
MTRTLVTCRYINMSKGATTIKEALAKWEEDNHMEAKKAKEIKLLAKIPPIEKMDASLSTLVACTMLSLSTNAIEKIANLNTLKNLKILSLARNNIKSLTGLEAVADTLEQLWVSHNLIEKLRGLGPLKKLTVLYVSNNNVKDITEVYSLSTLKCLEELLIVGNPLLDVEDPSTIRASINAKCTQLKKLDGVPVVRSDEDD